MDLQNNEIELNNENFDNTVLKSKIPVIVDFFADWCGPCKRFAPIFKEYGKNNMGKVLTGKVNISNEAEIALKYDVLSIPTLIFFKGGEIVGRNTGFMSLEELETMANNYFGNAQ